MDIFGLTVTIVIFVVGIPIAYFIGRRNRQLPDLRSAVDFDEVLSPGEWLTRGDLDITYDGEPLTRVSRTYIALWNRRGDTVRGSDILERDPLRIVVAEGDKILQTRVVSMSRTQIAATVGSDENHASLRFEFLDHGDGFIVEVMHCGVEAAVLAGTVPGAAIAPARRIVLSRRARDLLRQPWPKRVWSLVSAQRGRLALPLVTLIVAAGYSLYQTATVASRLSAPQVVDASAFDLATFEGQRGFSAAVSRAGQPDTFEIVNSIITGFLCLAVVFMLVWIFRARVPRAIANNDTDPYSKSKLPAD